jgi:hypothetical protein
VQDMVTQHTAGSQRIIGLVHDRELYMSHKTNHMSAYADSLITLQYMIRSTNACAKCYVSKIDPCCSTYAPSGQRLDQSARHCHSGFPAAGITFVTTSLNVFSSFSISSLLSRFDVINRWAVAVLVHVGAIRYCKRATVV